MMCFSPIWNSTLKMNVPCGKCYPCRARVVSDWAVRLHEEWKSSTSSYFITLTYDDENREKFCPKVGDFYSLCKSEAQLFIKRLRKNIYPYEVRYFLVGEYGGKFERPHFHLLLFNFPTTKKDLYFEIDKAWQSRGNPYYGDVNPRTIFYVAGYLLWSFGTLSLPQGAQPPFMLCSRRPAIGSDYISPAVVEYHKNNAFNGYRRQGRTSHLPRLYSSKIFSDKERERFREEKLDHSDRIWQALGLNDLGGINEKEFFRLYSSFLDELSRRAEQRAKKHRF